MADFGAPIAKPVDPNQGLSTLSNLIALKSGMQGLQGQQSQNVSFAAEAQKNQQAMIERQNLQRVLQTGKDDQGHDIRDANGDPDPDKLASVIPRLMPTTGQPVLQNIIKTKSDKVGLAKSLSDLTGQQREQIGGIIAGSIGSPVPVKSIKDGLDAYLESNPSAAGAVHYASNLLDTLNGMPPGEQRDKALDHLRKSLQNPSQLATQQQPSTALTTGPGGAIQPVNTNPQAPGGIGVSAPPIAQGVAPNRQPITNAYGEVFTFNPATGNYEPAHVGGGGGQPSGSQPVGTPPRAVGAGAPGEREATIHQAEQNFANVTSTREAANAVPQQLDQINKARELTREVQTAGSWSRRKADIESIASGLIPGLKTASDDATKMQLLDKFLERITSDSERVLGKNSTTDAARDSIHRQNANVGYTPEAIRSVLDYAAAQSQAMLAKAKAQERWLKKPGNSVARNHQDFETAWRENYDPVLFQLQVAKPSERAGIIKSLPAEEAASLGPKYRALQNLENGK